MDFLLLLLLLAPAVLIIFLVAMQTTSRRNRHRRLPPGPKGLPFIGNLLQIDPSKPHASMADLSTKYGPLIHLKFFRMSLIVISSAQVAKEALKANDLAFAGRPSTSTSMKLSYGHSDIFTSPYTDYCKRMRKMVVNNLFSPLKLRSFRPTREEEVSRMIAEISEKASSKQLINVGETTTSLSCNVLCRLAFGKKFERGTESWRRFDKIVKSFSRSLIRNFVPDCLLFGWVNKVNGAAASFEKKFQDMDRFYQELVDEHLSPERPEYMNDDVLDLLIQMRGDSSATVKIDWKHIKAILMNLFVAGIESGGGTLLWAVTALMKDPSKMKKLQEEIRSIVGKKSSIINEDDIEKLPYLKAVLKETMRLYPMVPLIPKETIHPCIINGYEIEAKTFVLVNTWAIGRDPEYWENPNEFLPERFLNMSIDVKGQDFGLIPFGSGRRMCPGLPLAISTMELALANLVYFFTWEIPGGISGGQVDTATSVGLGLHKKKPLWLVAKTCM